MRGITIELLTQHQSETYRVLNEVQLLMSFEGILDLQLNGKHIHGYNRIIIINNLDIVKIQHAQALMKISIPMHFFSNYTDDYYSGFFKQEHFTSQNKVKSLLKHIIKTNENDRNQILVYDVLKILFEETYMQLDTLYLPDIRVNNKLLNTIFQYVYNHIDSPITLQILSDHFFVSKSYISILFTKHLNYSFKHFFTTLKIGLTLHPLLLTNATLQNIAVQRGFSSYNNYSKVFKSYMGMSPVDYRSHYKEQDEVISIASFDFKFFNNYLNQEHHTASSVHVPIDLSAFIEPTYTHQRQLFLEINNMHIYEAIQKVVHPASGNTHQRHLTLFFKQPTLQDMTFDNTMDLNHFCQLMVSYHITCNFYFTSMSHFEAFDKLLLQPLLYMIAANPNSLSLESLQFAITLASYDFSEDEIMFIRQHIQKYLPHSSIGLSIALPLTSADKRSIGSLKKYDAYFDYYCLPFDKLPWTKDCASIRHIECWLKQFKQTIDDAHTPIVLLNLNENVMKHLWNNAHVGLPNQFLALLLQLPADISGIGIPIVSSVNQPIAYFNQYGHQLPYSLIYNIHQYFAGMLNIQTDHYLLNETKDAYLILLFEQNAPMTETKDQKALTYHYQIFSMGYLSKQLVVTYTYDDIYSNVIHGIARDIEHYYLPLQDVQHVQQTFQLQPHITVHNFQYQKLHTTLPHQQIKLLKIYKHPAMLRQRIENE
ncbi:helix-turn-helix transcriptional regulator [Staphylococcus sp. 17KM0847]|uniref:helix-turn-helix transcriptional regulator n=1 Tax=Staphylococcus sp. 17KM0847 TaxID=2583989 RepID=UPI0015DC0AC8|nr:response regulator transcription factor [Staphylococcus sp. 17KM0847]QLK86734.1 helix-turn-helix domain-containing protein [Staphylococcus sp. 17KM0847]